MRAATLTTALSLILSAPASAQFEIDMTVDEVNALHGISTISDLAANERAYVGSLDAGFCLQNDQLFINGHSRLSEPPRDKFGFSVRRLAGEEVEIDVEAGLDGERHLEDTLLQIVSLAAPIGCEEVRQRLPYAGFFAVRTVDGYNNLSTIVADHLQEMAKTGE